MSWKVLSCLSILTVVLTASGTKASDFSPSLTTTDATIQDIAGQVTVSGDSVCRVNLYVAASDHSFGAALWTITTVTRRIGDGVVAAITATDKKASLAAASWTVNPVYGGDAGNGAIKMQVQGGTGQTVDWLFYNDEPFCMTGPVV